MNCLDPDQAMLAALGLAESEGLQHLETCGACRAEVDALRPFVAQVAEAHMRFERGHAAGRRRLLAALAQEPAVARRSAANAASLHRFRTWLGAIPMQRRIAFSGIGLAAAGLLVAVLLSANRPLSAMEQVAAALREVKSYSFKMSAVFATAGRASETKVYWTAPGSRRMEDFAEGKPTEVEIFPYHQPGIRINPQQKTFLHMPAQQGAVSPLLLVSKLGGFRGQADRELGEKQIDGRAAQGFEIAVTKVDPGVPAGMLVIWVDAETKLPVLLEAEMPMPGENVKLKFADFQWNIDLDKKLFDTTPPAGYADNTPKPPALEEQTAAIVEALKFYAEVSDGSYPRVKMVYGDVTMHDLEKKIGLEGRPTAEQIKSDNYVRYLRAIQGFAWVNTIQRENADAAYYGKTVGAKDPGAVLLRWQLDDGRYQAIYGDLRAETLSGEQLKKLEGR